MTFRRWVDKYERDLKLINIYEKFWNNELLNKDGQLLVSYFYFYYNTSLVDKYKNQQPLVFKVYLKCKNFVQSYLQNTIIYHYDLFLAEGSNRIVVVYVQLTLLLIKSIRNTSNDHMKQKKPKRSTVIKI